MSHTLNPVVENLMEAVNSEFVARLEDNFNPDDRELFIQPEDLTKIIHTLTERY
jgi:hypothetical protein